MLKGLLSVSGLAEVILNEHYRVTQEVHSCSTAEASFWVECTLLRIFHHLSNIACGSERQLGACYVTPQRR